MIGIVFGAGASIDHLPVSFFDLIRDGAFLSFGVNRIAISKRLKTANYECDGYVMADSLSERPSTRKIQMTWIEAIRAMKNKIVYADKTMGIDGARESKLPVWHNSSELAARLLVHEHGCKELWLVGIDGCGPHCATVPAMDRFDRAWNMVQAKGAFFAMNNGKPAIWQQVIDDIKVPVRVYPHWSLLVPYIVERTIRVSDGSVDTGVTFE